MKPGDRLASQLKDRVRIERPVASGAFTGAGSGQWEEVDTVQAGIQDALPGRGEKLEGGIATSTGKARVRMRFRTDITAAMRFVEIIGEEDARVLQIVSGPARLGNRQGLEFMVEEYGSAGNAA